MNNDEQVWLELEELERQYRQAFPNAPAFNRFSFGPQQLIDLLREANGRELVFSNSDNVVDGGEYSFREPEAAPLTLQELLYPRGLPRDKRRVKLVRHRDTSGRIDLYALYRNQRAAFLDYQREQHKPVFRDCDYVVSFLGEEGSRARFIGVYQVLGVERQTETHLYYHMREVSGFEALKERLIIDWGSAAINWHQWLDADSPKTVLEIQTKPFSRSFTDYLDFTLTFAELQELVKNQSPRDEWRRMLSAVAGIYLILDTSTGDQYIGKASGVEGVWGRWAEYSRTNGHGNNLGLVELVALNADHAQCFQFTILLTLPATMPEKKVQEWEQLFKHKIGPKLCRN